jgi:predicted component of type VI protein secretion system
VPFATGYVVEAFAQLDPSFAQLVQSIDETLGNLKVSANLVLHHRQRGLGECAAHQGECLRAAEVVARMKAYEI